MTRIRTILVGVFLLAASVAMAVVVVSRPRILVIQSYYTDYSWTRDVDAGIRRVFGKSPRFSARWYYMDTKRNPSREFRERAGAAARQTIEDWHPDVVIAVDDDAQQFAARHFADHPAISVVFAGVNNQASDYGYHKAGNVTGILERQKLDAVQTALIDLGRVKGFKGPPRLLNLGDRSQTVAGDARAIAAFDWQGVRYLGSQLVGTFAEWQRAVQGAADQADFILTTNYRGLARSADDPSLVPASEVARWTEANARPVVVGTYGFWVEDGGALAIATSPFEQGEVAARMALQVLDGASPKTIPIQTTNQFIVFARGSALQQRGLTLPPIYEAFARATRNFID